MSCTTPHADCWNSGKPHICQGLKWENCLYSSLSVKSLSVSWLSGTMISSWVSSFLWYMFYMRWNICEQGIARVCSSDPSARYMLEVTQWSFPGILRSSGWKAHCTIKHCSGAEDEQSVITGCRRAADGAIRLPAFHCTVCELCMLCFPMQHRFRCF